MQEYAQEDKIKGLIEHFSLFTQYPIKLLMEKEVRLGCSFQDQGLRLFRQHVLNPCLCCLFVHHQVEVEAAEAEESTDEADAGDEGVCPQCCPGRAHRARGALLTHRRRRCLHTPAAEDDVEDVVEDASSSDSKPPKKEKRPVWEVLNRARPLWLRPANDVSANEYKDFYKAISKVCVAPCGGTWGAGQPLLWVHGCNQCNHHGAQHAGLR